MRTVLIPADLLWYLDAFLEFVSFHALDYKGPGVLRSTRAIDDRTPVRRCLCCHRGCGLVGGLFQQVCVLPVNPSQTDMVPSRGLHSAIFSLIGALGFLASAVLPATDYLVSTLLQPSA